MTFMLNFTNSASGLDSRYGPAEWILQRRLCCAAMLRWLVDEYYGRGSNPDPLPELMQHLARWYPDGFDAVLDARSCVDAPLRAYGREAQCLALLIIAEALERDW